MSNNDLTRPMRQTEERLGRPLREYIAEQYETRTIEQIAADLGISESGLLRWMDRLGIQRRFPGQRPTAVV